MESGKVFLFSYNQILDGKNLPIYFEEIRNTGYENNALIVSTL